MKKFIWKGLGLSPVSLGLVLGLSSQGLVAGSSPAMALDASLEPVDRPASYLAQVTSVSELSDVQPGDWAFTALQRLVEEYGCLEGYPDRTYRGNRALTRYEFAAGLNACLDVVIQLIGEGSQLDEIRRLQEEFAAELATIRGRVDTLETDVAELEANQFSTTTKLTGAFDAHLIVPFGDTVAVADNVISQDPAAAPNATDKIVGGEEADETFEYWARLDLNTSFTGEDNLFISLSAADAGGSLANSEFGLNYVSGQTDDNVAIDDLYYSFPVGDRINAKVAGNSVLPEDFVSSLIVPFGDSAVAAAGLPEFYFLYAGGDFGAGANVDITDSLVLDVAYLADGSNNNQPDQGLFNNYSYMAQLNLLTEGPLNAAVVYLDGDQETDVTGGAAGVVRSQVKPDYTVAGLVSMDLGRLVLSGHYAFSPADSVDGDLDSYMGGVSFPGLFGESNELGVYGGISPAINRDPLLVEAYYKLNVNEFVTFTPALIYTDNDSGVGTDDNFYGAVRATLSF
ncbi:MAG: iron uptake porin [Cyanobacteria bacterium P01_F01_bin.53]